MRKELRAALAMLEALIVLLLMPASALAQRAGEGAVSELPPRVRSTAGLFSLFADFSGASGGRVPVYLINRTGAPIVLDAQDGDPFLVREVRLEGAWVRAEPFRFSDCGLSYRSMRIEPDRFVRVDPRVTEGDEQGSVRYRLARHASAVASNLGRGRFSRAEVLAATHDELAMQSADLRAIEEALSHTPPLAIHERRMAFQRLRALRAREVMPLLEGILADDRRPEEDRVEALRAAAEIDPRALARIVLAVLDGPSTARRTFTLSQLRFTPLSDDALTTRLLELLRPDEPDLAYATSLAARSRRQDVRDALAAMSEDARFSAPARLHARFELAQWFSSELVSARLTPVGAYSDGHRLPVRMTLRITNTSDRPIELRYEAPTDLVELFVTRERGLDRDQLAPRPGVRWLTTPGPRATTVRLAPGAWHELPIALADYFELTPGSGLTVWPAARVPGLPDLPHLGGGAGLNVQP